MTTSDDPLHLSQNEPDQLTLQLASLTERVQALETRVRELETRQRASYDAPMRETAVSPGPRHDGPVTETGETAATITPTSPTSAPTGATGPAVSLPGARSSDVWRASLRQRGAALRGALLRIGWLPAPTGDPAGRQPGASSPPATGLSAAEADSAGLPEVCAAGDLASTQPRRRWILLCFGLTFAVYVALIPRFVLHSSPPTGDQPFYLMVTASLAQDHDLNLRNNYDRHDYDKFYGLAPHPAGFVGISAPYPLGEQRAYATARPPTESYNFHEPGLPLLLAPAWAIGSLWRLWWPATIVAMCLIGALVGLNIFLLAYEVTGRLWIAWAVWLPLTFSNPIMSYSYMIFTELPTGLLAIYAFRRLARGWRANGYGRLLVIGLCLGYLPWLAWRALVIELCLLFYAALQWWRASRAPSASAEGAAAVNGRRWTGHLVGAALVLAPILVSAVLLGWYHLFLYGNLSSPVVAPELGGASPFVWPWAGIAGLTGFVTAAFGLLFDRQMGLLTYAPIYLLAAVGIIALVRTGRAADRRLLTTMALTLLPYLGMLLSFVLWNGIWCPPARFLTTLVPFMAAPLAMALYALRKSLAYKGLYALLALPGFAFMAIMMYDARMMWPYPSLLAWLAGAPEAPVHVDLRAVLPAVSPVDEMTLPMNTAWETAVSLAIILGCFVLMARRRTWREVFASPPKRETLSWLGACAVVGSGWYVMNYQYLQHTTLLVEQHRWPLTMPPLRPQGIAYLDGRVYVADFVGRSVIVLDTRTGATTRLQPHSPHGVLPLAHPGDVKAGPDGTLSVLNNGPGAQALLIVRPDGRVLRQMALNGKSGLAVGLAFGPRGTLVATDMGLGHVDRYGPGGGNPLGTWGGMTGSLNNVAGVAADGSGTIYLAEEAMSRVQQLDVQGRFVRAYPLKDCVPKYLAQAGEWLDVSCESTHMYSINLRTGDVQRVRFRDGAPPAAPRGITYAPDGTLYVIDQATVIAYKVHH